MPGNPDMAILTWRSERECLPIIATDHHFFTATLLVALVMHQEQTVQKKTCWDRSGHGSESKQMPQRQNVSMGKASA